MEITEGINQGSEVKRLLQQIDEEYIASRAALTELAQGTARHEFIQRRMMAIAVRHEKLVKIVGTNEATRLLAECAERTVKEMEYGE